MPPVVTSGLQCTLTIQSGAVKREMRIIFGDIWFCTGQSNMQVRMGEVVNARQEMNKGTYRKRRKKLNKQQENINLCCRVMMVMV